MVVVPLSLFRGSAIFAVAILFQSSLACAQTQAAVEPPKKTSLLLERIHFHAQQADKQRYLAKLELNNADELQQLLMRAQRWSKSQSALTKVDKKPVAFVLHGAEAESLLQKNSAENESLLKLAMQLDADDVVNIQVCRTWMTSNGYQNTDFAPFVETVPFAPSEIQRLIQQEGYTYF